MLKRSELQVIKYLFDPRSNKKMYDRDDINNILVQKYGSVNFFNDMQINNLSTKRNKKKMNNVAINDRKEKLKDELSKWKLDYRGIYGLNYEYIYKNLDINDVIKHELQETSLITERTIEIMDLLTANGLFYDDNMISCNEYIYELSNRTNEEIIKMAKIENLLIEHTNYLVYVKEFGNFEDAKDKAILEYTKNNVRNTSIDELIKTILLR